MKFDEFLTWESTTRDTIDFKKIYVDMCDGEIIDGLILSELTFWHLPNKHGESKLRVCKDGKMWIAVSLSEWWDRARITSDQAFRAIERLCAKDIVVKQVFRYNNSPTTHLRINQEKFMEIWEYRVKNPMENPYKSRTRENDIADTRNPLRGDAKTLTETTTELTDNGDFEEKPPDPQDKSCEVSHIPGDAHQPSSQEERVEEKYKRRTLEALASSYQQKGMQSPIIDNFIQTVQPHQQGLARQFCELMGRKPGKKEETLWRAEWEWQHQLGIRAEHIKGAFDYMKEACLTIKSPKSVTTIAENIKKGIIKTTKSEQVVPRAREVFKSDGAAQETW
jgi:hypothetical protein